MFTNFRNTVAEILSSEIRSIPLSKFKKGQQRCPNSRGVSRTPHLPMVQRRTNRTHRTRQAPQILVFRHARSLNRHGRPDRPSIITGPPPSCPAPTGHPNVILISIHVNATGDGTQWVNATGWSCYTSKGQTQSDTLANCLYEAAIKNFPGRRIRTDYSDKDPDWEENFYLLRKTLCPAVLTENFFMDSHSDLEYLQSRAGKQAIIDTHVEGIIEYLESL